MSIATYTNIPQYIIQQKLKEKHVGFNMSAYNYIISSKRNCNWSFKVCQEDVSADQPYLYVKQIKHTIYK